MEDLEKLRYEEIAEAIQYEREHPVYNFLTTVLAMLLVPFIYVVFPILMFWSFCAMS